ADRGVGLAVLASKAELERLARVELDRGRALDLRKEQVDGIIDPHELEAAAGQEASHDLLARWIRAHGAAGELAPEGAAAALLAADEAVELERHEIRRARVDRRPVPALAGP